jgi:hypothetical protein
MTIRHFIAVNADTTNQLTIDGIGNTADEAIADAMRGIGLPSNSRTEEFKTVRDADGDIIEVMFVAQECTKELYDLVEVKGGAGLRWTRNDQSLQDVAND